MSPLHKQGKGISKTFPQPRVIRVVNGEASVELRSVQTQSCAIFPHSKQSHLKTKPVVDTPLSICPGDFLSPKLLQDPACCSSAGLSCHTLYSSCPGSLLPSLLAFLLFLGITMSLTQSHPTCYSLCPECSSLEPLQIPPPSSRSLLQCHLLRRPFPMTVKKRPFPAPLLSSPYPAAHISQQHLPAPEHILG